MSPVETPQSGIVSSTGRRPSATSAFTPRPRSRLVDAHENYRAPHHESQSDRSDNILIMVLASTLLMPLTDQFLVLRVVIAVLVFLFVFARPAPHRLGSFPITFVLIALFGVFAGATAALIVENSVAWDMVVHEFTRMLYYTLIMVSCIRLRSSFRTLLILCQVLLVAHLGVQLVQLSRPGLINAWIELHYAPGSIHHELATYPWPNFRSGSIYVNPNIYALFIPVFLSVFFQASRFSALKLTWIWVCLSFTSVVLTGSRSGLILTLACALAALFGMGGRDIRRRRNPVLVLLGAAGVVLALLITTVTVPIDSGRAFNIEGGFDDSIATKVTLLLQSLSNMDPLFLLFGDRMSVVASIQDMELAHIVVGFGFVGIVWYILLLVFLTRASRARLPFVSFVCFWTILFASASGSIVMNMAAFPFFAIVMLVDWYKEPLSFTHGTQVVRSRVRRLD